MNRPTEAARPRQKAGLEPVILIGLLGALLFFIVSGTIALVDLQTLRKDNERLVHSGEVIVTLGELLSSAQDAETGQRGFLLTNNETYLEPYNRAMTSVPLRLNELTQLTRDNPTQQAYIPGLALHINAKLAELKQTIDLRRTQGAAAARLPS